MPKIKLNTIYLKKANIFFRSGISLSLIITFQVFISMDTANFHVVNLSTLLLLYLKDIDTLSIYLNNIINQLIC